MKKKFQEWLNTIVGSWVKIFIAAFAGQLLYDFFIVGSVLAFDLKMLDKALIAGLAAVGPVVVNYLNPKDTRYGKNKDL